MRVSKAEMSVILVLNRDQLIEGGVISWKKTLVAFEKVPFFSTRSF